MCIDVGLVIFSVLLLQSSSYVTSVKILHLKAPEPVENGTVPHVIFDCDYTYDQNDVASLVVKWFLNNNALPVYQWIPPLFPQALGALTNRLDLDYKASDDNYTMHRALKILWPTVGLSGEYRCHVSSFINEDSKKDTLLIYARPRFVDVQYTKPDDDTVNVTCCALGIFPKPDVEMVIYKAGKESRTPVTGEISKVSSVDGLYDIWVYKLFQDKTLAAETVFECSFSIPNTVYKVRDRVTYYPGRGPRVNPNPTNVKSYVLSTEPSLIGVPTVMDTNGTQTSHIPMILTALIDVVLLTSHLWWWRCMM